MLYMYTHIHQPNHPMPQSLSGVHLHIIFSTKNHLPLIDDEIKTHLFHYIGGVCHTIECPSLQVGGYHDHIHILCRLSRNMSQAQLVEELKKRSSKWIKTRHDRYQNFYWQRGYGIFSVNPYNLDRVVGYIKNQETHHQKMTFKEEFRAYLEKFQIDYDERYVWD